MNTGELLDRLDNLEGGKFSYHIEHHCDLPPRWRVKLWKSGEPPVVTGMDDHSRDQAIRKAIINYQRVSGITIPGAGRKHTKFDACDEKYPCADCGVLRSESEGGKIFTVCDDCWDRRLAKSKWRNMNA